MTREKITAVELRRRAEERLQKRTPSSMTPLPADEAQRLLHELQVHRIELEMQNDELRYANEELEASRDRLVDLFDFAPVGYLMVSKEGLIVEANLTAAKLFDVARETFVHQPMARFIYPEDRKKYEWISDQLLEEKELQTCELRFLQHNDAFFWGHLEASTAWDETEGAVYRLVVIDITDRKRIEVALQEVHRQNREILESTTDAFLALTDDMRVSFVNSAAERMLKQHRGNLLGRKLFEIFPGGCGSLFEENILLAIRTKSPSSFQLELTVAALENWYEIRVYPRPNGITLYMQDITEHIQAKEKEAKLESVKRQLQKSESLSRMAGAIAHHFNNKLFVISGNLEMAMSNLRPDDGSQEYLNIARQASAQAAEVSNLMLTYLGQQIGTKEVVDLAVLCRKMMPLLEVTLPENVVMKSHLQTPGPTIEANADHIRQMLTNLVTNAHEACGDEPGIVSVAVQQVSPSEISTTYRFPADWHPEHTAYACLEIRDNGCGIADKDIEEIFSPFFTTKFAGRGLGLSVVFGIVKSHHGVITVRRLLKKGVVFRVFFPIFIKKTAQQSASCNNASTTQEIGNVLLVDDDEMVLDLTSLMLENLGFTVMTALDGIEAVDLFSRHQEEIRLVISDVSMPRMNGWEVLHALRQIRLDIPVIFSSAHNEEQVMSEVHPEHPDAFLGKPYGRIALRDTIYRVLREAKARK